MASSAVVAALLLTLLSPVAAQSASAPDFSRYDCTALQATTPTKQLHIGQVISGRYYEWNEIYRTDVGQPQLACIGLLKPSAQQLDLKRAQTFIAHSLAIGTPTQPNRQTQSSVNGATSHATLPANVQPEPLKHVIQGGTPSAKPAMPTPATQSNTAAQTGTTGQSPAPAGRSPTEQGTAGSPALETEAATDPRSKVSVSTAETYPWNTIGYLLVTYPNGQMYSCTATLVSAYVVLTAGHCIHNNDRGGYVTQIQFYPGQTTNTSNAITTPYGVMSNWSKIQTTQTWTQISGPDSFVITDYASDIAAIQFATAATFTSTFMPVLYESVESPVTNSGYPGSIEGVSGSNYAQYTMTGDEDTESQESLEFFNVREFSIYSSAGDSGSPFWITDVLGRTSLVGSLSYGGTNPTASGGPWYDYWNEQLLSNWIAWTPGTAAANTLVSDGLHVGAVISSAQGSTGLQSYLRFFNYGNSSGDVSVTLENPTTGATLATWTSGAIPPNAELQFSVSTIESEASGSFTKPAYYSLTIRPGITGYFQHVIYDANAGTLSDLSTCDDGGITNPSLLVAVHSSLLASSFPSTVLIYNPTASASSAQLGVYNALNGNQIGTYTTASIPAGGQLLVPVSAIESALSYTPSAGQYHYVIEVQNSFSGYLQNIVSSSQTTIETDMSTMCVLPPA